MDQHSRRGRRMGVDREPAGRRPRAGVRRALWAREQSAGVSHWPPPDGLGSRQQASAPSCIVAARIPVDLRERFAQSHGDVGAVVQYFGYTAAMANRGDEYGGAAQFVIYSTSAVGIAAFSLSREFEAIIPRQASFMVDRTMSDQRPGILSEGDGKSVPLDHRFEARPQFTRMAPALSDAELDAAVEEHARLRNEWLAAGGKETEKQKACRERMDYVQFYGMTK